GGGAAAGGRPPGGPGGRGPPGGGGGRGRGGGSMANGWREQELGEWGVRGVPDGERGDDETLIRLNWFSAREGVSWTWVPLREGGGESDTESRT
ncbi:MAG: hypothetical protein F4X60_01880, partial [Gemmatimonadetes bacterium]|nr:hypothetical protein [Gemmatimonadota bacterium]